MTMNLNLLPSEAKFQAARIKAKAKINKVMLLVSVVWVFGLIIVFILWFLTKITLAADEKKYKQAAVDFQGISDTVLNSEQLKYRAKLAVEILNSRFEYGKAFKTITDLFPPEISLENYELKSEKIFDVSGVIKDWRGVEQLEKIIRDINGGLLENFTSTKLNSLSFDSAKGWLFSMEVNIK